MTYGYPATWLHISIAMTNVATDFVLIAAAGAGKSIRVVAIHTFLIRTAVAGAWDVAFSDGIGGNLWWSELLQQPGRWSSEPFVPPFPGIPGTANTRVNVNAVGTVAGPVSARIDVGYYVDDV